MRLDRNLLLFLPFLVLPCLSARRVRVQPVEYEDDPYYADPQDDSSSRAVVLIGEDGNYYQPQVRGQDNYIPVTHRSSGRISAGTPGKDTRPSKEKTPPVQTIRNYNKVNDDGSFTFGYEAADGSFKEETRGTDCVVRGKYGYVDPDGNKREFTYVSGNPCDPNAPKEEEESREQESSAEPENVPQNYPTRPIRPVRPVTEEPRVVYTYQEEEEEEPEQVLRHQPIQQIRHRLAPTTTPTPLNYPTLLASPSPSPSPTPRSRPYSPTPTPLPITPRPITITPTPTTPRPQPPPTTYRPQLLQVAPVTPRPALVYTTKQVAVPARTVTASSAGSAARDFVQEYERFRLDSTTERQKARPAQQSAVQTEVQPNSNPVYSSELIFDPSSGQYKTLLHQSLPHADSEFTLNHRIQPYVHQPAQQVLNVHHLQQQSPLYRPVARPAHTVAQPVTPANTQAAYQAQQQELQFQHSQQLFAQQERARQQQRKEQQEVQPQQFYYIQPQALQGGANGQIEAFLRGHNIQY